MGVPRFVDSDAYTASFSFESDIHRRTQFDENSNGDSTRRFVDVTGLRPEELRGKTVLDAGVGTGRFSDVVSSCGARVHYNHVC
jgi:predicted RNA methylase